MKFFAAIIGVISFAALGKCGQSRQQIFWQFKKKKKTSKSRFSIATSNI